METKLPPKTLSTINLSTCYKFGFLGISEESVDSLYSKNRWWETEIFKDYKKQVIQLCFRKPKREWFW